MHCSSRRFAQAVKLLWSNDIQWTPRHSPPTQTPASDPQLDQNSQSLRFRSVLPLAIHQSSCCPIAGLAVDARLSHPLRRARHRGLPQGQQCRGHETPDFRSVQQSSLLTQSKLFHAPPVSRWPTSNHCSSSRPNMVPVQTLLRLGSHWAPDMLREPLTGGHPLRLLFSHSKEFSID